MGFETSCDETGIAVVEKTGRRYRVLVSEVASQVSVHAQYGGVVPEIASRQHLNVISRLAEQTLARAGGHVDAIAATVGPGLMGSLLVGVNYAKAIAYAWRAPFIAVHHIEGHIFSVFLLDNPPAFPFLSLVVSGGHTALIQCDVPHAYRLLGTTRDDAVGECFDKVARLLELPYPGGPSIQKTAESGDPNVVRFPRGLERSGDLNFSYSGLKTAVLYYVRGHTGGPLPVADIAASFQHAAVDILISKTKLAIEQTGARRLVVAGGVAANQLLRKRLIKELDAEVYLPPMALCIDNGAMIAAAGASRFEHGLVAELTATPSANLPL